MSTSMAPKLMFSLCAGGEMWPRTSSSMRRPDWRIESTARAVVLRRPGHHRLCDQREAPGLLGLRFDVAGPHGSFVGVEQIALEGVQGLSCREILRRRPGRRGSGRYVDRATQRPVFLQRRRERVLPSRRRESLPTSSEVVACPTFSDPAMPSRSS
jgi:hypothetical protein